MVVFSASMAHGIYLQKAYEYSKLLFMAICNMYIHYAYQYRVHV